MTTPAHITEFFRNSTKQYQANLSPEEREAQREKGRQAYKNNKKLQQINEERKQAKAQRQAERKEAKYRLEEHN